MQDLTPAYLLFGLLAIALALFAWGRWRYDVVALITLIGAVILGLVPADQAFTGFGHPAVITVAAVLAISRALQRSGALQPMAQMLLRLPPNDNLRILASTLVVTVASAFMNNVGALALFLPVVIQLAAASSGPPSRYFMPLAFGSLLGGMCTLIGTPPNLIIAAFQARTGEQPFGMFDFAPVGLVLVVGGIAFMALGGWRLIPERRDSLVDREQAQVDDYIVETKVSRGGSYVDKTIGDLEEVGGGDFAVVALVRRKKKHNAPGAEFILKGGDTLLIEGDPETLADLLAQTDLKLIASPATISVDSEDSEVQLAEAVVKPGSVMEGRTAGSLRLHARYKVNLLAISRKGRPVRQHIGHIQFRQGDVLLLQGREEDLTEAIASLDCFSLGQLNVRFGGATTLIPAGIFALAVLLVTTGLVAVPIAFVAALIAIVLLRHLSLRELYSSIDWPIIILLGAMLPLGVALEQTGGAQLLASGVLALPADTPLALSLFTIMLVTMLLSNLVNNAATALLMAPIAVDVSLGLGASSAPFLMAVAVASSAAFLTPIGHQSNLLVMGPGGYRFGDFWRLGAPMSALVLASSTFAIPIFWPY